MMFGLASLDLEIIQTKNLAGTGEGTWRWFCSKILDVVRMDGDGKFYNILLLFQILKLD